MNLVKWIAGSMVAISMMAAPAVFAADAAKTAGMDEFMKSCDLDGDGTVSKSEMRQHVEKMFDEMDSRKTGKLDKKQSEAFLKQLSAPTGA